MPITLTTLQNRKQNGEKITMLTCYDATFAAAANEAGVDILLIGDSLGMVLQGMKAPCRYRSPTWPTTPPA